MTRRLSVLAISPVAEAGGAENLLLGVLAGLADRGVRVCLVVLGSGPLPRLAAERGISVSEGPALSFRSPGSVALSALSVRRAARNFAADLVLASHAKGQLIGRLACGGHQVQVTQLYDPPGWSVSSMLAARLPGLRLAITAETAATHALRNPAWPPVVIPPGIDLHRLKRLAEEGDGPGTWARAGVDSPGARIVMVGRLQRFKGHLDFIEMASIVLRRQPSTRFLMVGPDSPLEPNLRSELKAEIARRGLAGAVALADRLSDADLAATIAVANLLVHPAQREPFGLVVAEALALGTPVIAYAASGPRNILSKGGGLLVPPGDIDRLARAVTNSINDPDLVDAWRVEGRAAMRAFDLGRTVGRYLEVINQAVHEGPPRAVPEIRRGTVAMMGAVPPGASGVRDYGHLLATELRRRHVPIVEDWVENDGVTLRRSMTSSARLLGLALQRPSPHCALWHYSPFAYSYRGLPGPGILVGLVLRARRRRVVTVLHELAYTCQPGMSTRRQRLTARAQHAALKIVLLGSHHVVVTTTHRRNQLSTSRRGPAVEVIPVFATIPVARPALPRQEKQFWAAVLGYAGDGARPDVLLDAISLTHSLVGLRLVLLGAPGQASSAGREWQRLARRAGVASCLEFTGVVEAQQFSQRLAQCEVVVLVNEEGPSSRKTTLATALAHGLPVLALDGVNRWDELVAAGAVEVVPPDAAALASALTELRHSPWHRAVLGSRGRQFYEERMSLATAADRFVAILDGGGIDRGSQWLSVRTTK